jgi:hypothetical protein
MSKWLGTHLSNTLFVKEGFAFAFAWQCRRWRKMSAHQVPLYLLLPWRQLDQRRCEDEQRHGESASTRSRAPQSHPQAYVSSDPLLNLISYLLHWVCYVMLNIWFVFCSC